MAAYNVCLLCRVLELDVCVYLMSAVAVQMEVEEGANATVTDLITAMVGEEELGLPRNTQVFLCSFSIQYIILFKP